MKSLISKTVATVSLVSMLSTATLANTNIAALASKIEKGASVEEITKDLKNNSISKAEILDYLSENTSAITFKAVSEAIDAEDANAIIEAFKQEQGSQYATEFNASECLTLMGGAAFFAFLVVYGGSGLIDIATPGGLVFNEYEANQLRDAKLGKNVYQEEINSLLASGHAPTSNEVFTRKLKVEELSSFISSEELRLQRSDKHEKRTAIATKLAMGGVVGLGAYCMLKSAK